MFFYDTIIFTKDFQNNTTQDAMQTCMVWLQTEPGKMTPGFMGILMLQVGRKSGDSMTTHDTLKQLVCH